MFTITIDIPQDVLNAGSVQAAMYGELLESYTPSVGPCKGQTLNIGQWVYFTGSDYAAVATTVPSFATYTTAGCQQVDLPDVQIQASHIIFGIGCLPAIPVVSGAPQQPTPLTATTIYDFVEFTYNTQNILYLNTSMIDQFGIPIQIQIDPADAILPDGAGVTLDRADVFSAFSSDVGDAFLQCAQDPFGNSLTTRILSPGDAITGNCVQGVVANSFTGPPSTLAPGLYYYAVTALDSAATESFAQSNVVQATVTQGEAVTVAWAPNSSQPAGAASYNVYRGTPASGSVSWGLLGNVVVAKGVGGALTDTGQSTQTQTPPINPLATYFDSQIQEFFGNYLSGDSQLVLTATDGTDDGYVYSFQGTTVTDSSNNIVYLQLTLTSVVDSSGNSVSSPPIPMSTPFNIYYPYWNTNTFNSNNPSPPTWALYQQITASTMVFAAEGVFADSAQQAQSNLPPNVENSGIYATLLGSLENQIVAALTRGIANSAIAPQNWGNPPNQLPPTLTSGTSTLTSGTTYYYVITAVNAQGETVGSFEFNATPTTSQPCVQLNWQPLGQSQASSFNVYRGTASLQENVLAASVSNSGSTSSYVDDGSSIQSQNPPVYFPAGVPANAYDAFFHQPSVSLYGVAYASPYDDQGGQSSTLSGTSPTSVSITLGPWTAE